ncbi:uncharacterized protein LOC121372626 [Gigantopelta aegis]|uniref:uncharacterized protein LOC121372626 n=1 Tax=Gigantopelta aegis TaxID=1735272 RepID=UPI001B88856A|nr:uncharacterized protein LOC121372626 [Gigantopelta aegis]
MSDLKKVQAVIQSSDSDFIINATKSGLDSVTKALKELARNIEQKKCVHKKTGICKLMQSLRGSQFIAGLQSSERCIIETEFDDVQTPIANSHHTVEAVFATDISNLKVQHGVPEHYLGNNLNNKDILSNDDLEQVSLPQNADFAFDGDVMNVDFDTVKDGSKLQAAKQSSFAKRPDRKNRQFDKPSMATACFGDPIAEKFNIAAQHGKTPRTMEDSAISLYYFSDKVTHLNRCIEWIERFCEEETVTKTLEDVSLKNLNPSQIEKVKSLEKDYQVKVTYQRDCGQLHIQGLLQDVSDASDVVHKILREVDGFELECQKAEILSNLVQWYFIDVDKQGEETLTKYDKDVNGTIEKAFYDKYPIVTLQAGGFKYIIDFSTMEEYPADNRLDSVKVVRNDLIRGTKSKIKLLDVESVDFKAVQVLVGEQLVKKSLTTSVLPSGKIQLKCQDSFTEAQEMQNIVQALIRQNVKLESKMSDQEMALVLKNLQDSAPQVYCAYIPDQQIIAIFAKDQNGIDAAKQKIVVYLKQIKSQSEATRVQAVVREEFLDANVVKLEVDSHHFEAAKRLKIVGEKQLQKSISVNQLKSGKVQLIFKTADEELQNRIQALFREDISLEGANSDQQKITSVIKHVQDSIPDIYCAHIPDQQIVTLFGEDCEKIDAARRNILVGLGQVKIGYRGRRTCTSSSKTMDSVQKAKVRSVFKNQTMAGADTTGVQPFIKGKLLDVMVYKGDITRLSVDAIVNATNGRLAHGAGVARAIADAAGDELLKEGNRYIQDHGVISVSGVAVTTAGRLPCKKVLHAVGPAMFDYKDKTHCLEDLCKTILRCLCEARNLNMTSVAIPSISSGIFGVPKPSCAEVYVRAVKSFDMVVTGGSLRQVHFVDVNDTMLHLIQQEFVNEWNKKLDYRF